MDVDPWPHGLRSVGFVVDVADAERSVHARRCFESFM